MRRFEVVYRPEAVAELQEIFRYARRRSQSRAVVAFVVEGETVVSGHPPTPAGVVATRVTARGDREILGCARSATAKTRTAVSDRAAAIPRVVQ